MILPPCLPIGETISHLVVDASSHLSLVGSGGPKFMAHDLRISNLQGTFSSEFSYRRLREEDIQSVSRIQVQVTLTIR